VWPIVLRIVLQFAEPRLTVAAASESAAPLFCALVGSSL
jgi:hypothetical protein